MNANDSQSNTPRNGETIIPIPECFRSRSRLFLSIDLIGSTALKQGRIIKECRTGWRDPMLEFYHSFQHLFAQKWCLANTILNNLGRHDLDPPKLWKAAGDELIYSQLMLDSYQVCLAVRAWIEAAKFFRNDLRNKFPSLDVKMTAWTASFPVINTEIVLESDPNKVLSKNGTIRSNVLTSMFNKLNDYYSKQNPEKINAFLDFIGPSMDIGFRLCGLSSQRQMPISVELAFILSSVQKNSKNNLDNLDDFSEPKLRYTGKKRTERCS
ncbi:MAG: hypothetical protein H7839_07655 [Magnetococcus sp. YQC-5]